MYLNRDTATKKMKRANEDQDRWRQMRGGKCRSLNSIIYGIIILVRFIFEVTYHNISSKG